MSCEDSSSEEDTEKFKEATWTFTGTTTNVSHTNGKKDPEENNSQSRRTVASEHENDGNELQTTPEFRAHVAKKLGAVLDCCIAEVCVTNVPSSQAVEKTKEEEEEEGFRLFSTSVPGMAAPPAVPTRKRPAPSSSDSDDETERRCKEVAVTISDIVRPYYTEKTAEMNHSDDDKEDTCDNAAVKKKKKKKKKKNVPTTEKETENGTEGCPDNGMATNIGASSELHAKPSHAQEEMKKTKKKKKKKNVPATQEENGDESKPCPNNGITTKSNVTRNLEANPDHPETEQITKKKKRKRKIKNVDVSQVSGE